MLMVWRFQGFIPSGSRNVKGWEVSFFPSTGSKLYSVTLALLNRTIDWWKTFHRKIIFNCLIVDLSIARLNIKYWGWLWLQWNLLELLKHNILSFNAEKICTYFFSITLRLDFKDLQNTLHLRLILTTPSSNRNLWFFLIFSLAKSTKYFICSIE